MTEIHEKEKRSKMMIKRVNIHMTDIHGKKR